MDSFVITCCSTSDLTAEHLKQRKIPFACFHFTLDGVSYLDDFGASIQAERFYALIGSGAESKTAQVNISEYLSLFLPILRDGKDILHVCLSTGLSGTYNSACNAAIIAREQFPERKIYIIDSLGASSGYGFLVDCLADLRDFGYSIDACREWAEENRLRIHHWFFSGDLKFYIRGGRINKTAGIVGSMLGICPILNMDENGCLVPRYKIRTKKKAIQEMASLMAKHAENGTNYAGKCYISHSACFEDAKALADQIERVFPHLDGNVKIYNVGAVIGSHTGPGTVALFFLGSSRALPQPQQINQE